MGNINVGKFLEEPTDWSVHLTASWRSDRAREADNWGGLVRDTIPLGGSLTAKMQHLEGSMRQLGSTATQWLEPGPMHRHSSFTRHQPVAFTLSTERRAMERSRDAKAAKDTGLLQEAQQKEVVKRPVAVVKTANNQIVAEWRVRVHASRRRVIIVIRAVLRLQRRLRHRPRYGRPESLAFMLPSLLGDDWARFIEEQQKVHALRAEVEACQAAIEYEKGLLEQEDAAARGEMSPTKVPSTLSSRPGTADSSAVDESSQQLQQQQQPRYMGRRSTEILRPSIGRVSLSGAEQRLLSSPTAYIARLRSGLRNLAMSEDGSPTPLISNGNGNGAATAGDSPPALSPRPPNGHANGGGEAAAANGVGALGAFGARANAFRRMRRSSACDALPSPLEVTETLCDAIGVPSSGASPDSSCSTSPSRSPRASPAAATRRAALLLSPTASSRVLQPTGMKQQQLLGRPATGALLGGAPPLLGLQGLGDPRPRLHQKVLARMSDSGFNPSGSFRSGRVSDSTGQGIAVEDLQAASASSPGGGARPVSRSPSLRRSPSFSSSGGPPEGKAYGAAVPSLLTATSAPPGSKTGGHLQPLQRSNSRGVGSPVADYRQRRLSSPATAEPPLEEDAVSTPADASSPTPATPCEPNGLRQSPSIRRRLVQSASFSRSTISPKAASSAVAAAAAAPATTGTAAAGGGGRPAALQIAAAGPRVPLEELEARLADEVKKLMASAQLLAVHVNRCNARWSDVQPWQTPEVGELSRQWLTSDSCKWQRRDVVEKLGLGQIAFQILAGEDYLHFGNGKWQDLWTADPYLLVERVRPGLMPLSDRINGISMGSRIMTNLSHEVLQLLGTPDLLHNVTVVLHVNEEQQEDVVQDLWDNKFYGFRREKVLVVVQPRQLGYLYDTSTKRFEEVPVTADDGSVVPVLDNAGAQEREPVCSGSGYSLLQMSWTGQTFMLNEEGLAAALEKPLLDHLAWTDVEWIVSRQCRDMTLLSKREGAVDVDMLAHCLTIRSSMQANMVSEVVLSDSPRDLHSYGSLILRSMPFAGTSGGVDDSEASVMGDVELRSCELGGPRMQAVLKSARAHGGALTLALQRHILHLPTLRGLLRNGLGWQALRPKLRLHNEYVQVLMDVGDLATQTSTKYQAIRARHHHGHLTRADNLEALIALVNGQDNDITFRRQIMSHRRVRRPLQLIHNGEEKAPAPFKRKTAADGPTGVRGATPNSVCVIAFVCDNAAMQSTVRMAALVAQSARDRLLIATIIPSGEPTSQISALMTAARTLASRLTRAELKLDVVQRGNVGLLDCMASFVKDWEADLVVMGKAKLSNAPTGESLGSVTLSALRRLPAPLLILPQNSSTLFADNGSIAWRALALIDPAARLVFAVLLRLLLDCHRDSLVLAHASTHVKSHTQQLTDLRLGKMFYLMSSDAGHTPSSTLHLQGQYEQVLLQACTNHKINLLVLQLPQEDRVPLHVTSLLRQAQSAMLVCRA